MALLFSMGTERQCSSLLKGSHKQPSPRFAFPTFMKPGKPCRTRQALCNLWDNTHKGYASTSLPQKLARVRSPSGTDKPI